MEKSSEHIIHQWENWCVVRFTYYFKTKEECENYVLKENEKLICRYYLMDETSEFKWAMVVEAIKK
jgi:hypothetical protein